MKILYGVQGTGNGHITRARAMAAEFSRLGLEVSFVFSGRPADQFMEMQAFGDYRVLRGLTFTVADGQVKYFATLKDNSIIEFIRDVRQLAVNDYDLVVTDFEPVTAWAARCAKVNSIGIGHQYAFNYPVPVSGDSFVTRGLMRYFAPVNQGIGLHWHHFEHPILPPIIFHPDSSGAPDLSKAKAEPEIDPNLILVYLPFENTQDVIDLLNPFRGYRFAIFSNRFPQGEYEHISVYPQSVGHFQAMLAKCNGVICNAGFELSSEALHLGKRILVKPLHKQMEQLSNAAAMEVLGIGTQMKELDATTIGRWLDHSVPIKVHYPNVARVLANWLIQPERPNINELATELWSKTSCRQRPELFHLDAQTASLHP